MPNEKKESSFTNFLKSKVADHEKTKQLEKEEQEKRAKELEAIEEHKKEESEWAIKLLKSRPFFQNMALSVDNLDKVRGFVTKLLEEDKGYDIETNELGYEEEGEGFSVGTIKPIVGRIKALHKGRTSSSQWKYIIGGILLLLGIILFTAGDAGILFGIISFIIGIVILLAKKSKEFNIVWVELKGFEDRKAHLFNVDVYIAGQYKNENKEVNEELVKKDVSAIYQGLVNFTTSKGVSSQREATAEPKKEAKSKKYCSECGASILNDSKFCPECGKKLVTS